MKSPSWPGNSKHTVFISELQFGQSQASGFPRFQSLCFFFSVSFVQDDPGADKENSMLPPSGVVPSAKVSEDNVIDNPYLRPVKKPKVRRKK